MAGRGWCCCYWSCSCSRRARCCSWILLFWRCRPWTCAGCSSARRCCAERLFWGWSGRRAACERCWRRGGEPRERWASWFCGVEIASSTKWARTRRSRPWRLGRPRTTMTARQEEEERAPWSWSTFRGCCPKSCCWWISLWTNGLHLNASVKFSEVYVSSIANRNMDAIHYGHFGTKTSLNHNNFPKRLLYFL